MGPIDQVEMDFLKRFRGPQGSLAERRLGDFDNSAGLALLRSIDWNTHLALNSPITHVT
jgi:hypothetical protein